MTFQAGIDKALNNTKQDQEIGIGGFRLFGKVGDSVSYSNIVPVDILEDGTNATDDIINNPISITIDGNVGDVFIDKKQSFELIQRDFSEIGEVTEFLPAKTQQQIQRASQINSQLRDAQLAAERVKRIGGNVYNFVSGNQSQSKSDQEKFIEYMEAIYFSKNLISVSTTYRDYKNMALEDLVINTNNQDGYANFSAKFKQVNLTSLIFVPIQRKYNSPSQSLSGKTSDQANKGGQTPESNQEQSLLSALIGG